MLFTERTRKKQNRDNIFIILSLFLVTKEKQDNLFQIKSTKKQTRYADSRYVDSRYAVTPLPRYRVTPLPRYPVTPLRVLPTTPKSKYRVLKNPPSTTMQNTRHPNKPTKINALPTHTWNFGAITEYRTTINASHVNAPGRLVGWKNHKTVLWPWT